ncbi:hypothetical protein [[Eubacterium] cellulosolvens]
MTREFVRGTYSEEEIEEIIWMGASEARPACLLLKKVRDTVGRNPLLAGALVFGFGILLGVLLIWFLSGP